LGPREIKYSVCVRERGREGVYGVCVCVTQVAGGTLIGEDRLIVMAGTD
jgi:hypothetical protein